MWQLTVHCHLGLQLVLSFFKMTVMHSLGDRVKNCVKTEVPLGAGFFKPGYH